jgi:hypothetical protein
MFNRAAPANEKRRRSAQEAEGMVIAACGARSGRQILSTRPLERYPSGSSAPRHSGLPNPITAFPVH